MTQSKYGYVTVAKNYGTYGRPISTTISWFSTKREADRDARSIRSDFVEVSIRAAAASEIGMKDREIQRPIRG